MLDEKAGEDGSGDAGEIADEVLQAGPAAGGARAGENLRDDPGVGNVEAVCGGGKKQKQDGGARAGDGGSGDGDSAEGLAERDHAFANGGDAVAGGDEFIGREAGKNADKGHEGVSERGDFSHLREREILLTDEVIGQPGEKKI